MVRAVAVTWILEPTMQIGIMEVVVGVQCHTMPKLTAKQRQDKLFEELDLSGLESWPPKLTDSTQSILAKYHVVFSLEPCELGCTHSTEHIIKVTDNTPFKGMVQMNSPTIGGRSLYALARNVGFRQDLPQPEHVV